MTSYNMILLDCPRCFPPPFSGLEIKVPIILSNFVGEKGIMLPLSSALLDWTSSPHGQYSSGLDSSTEHFLNLDPPFFSLRLNAAPATIKTQTQDFPGIRE